MRIADISIVGAPVRPSSAEAVSGAEVSLGLTFPVGYQEYITTFGAGVLGGTYVRVYPPERIIREYRDLQRRWDEYWFWDDGRDVLTKTEALECIIIADTLDGDEIIFHPSRPDRLLVLPRHSEMVYEAGTDLLSALDWLCSAGVLTEPFSEREFEPFTDETV